MKRKINVSWFHAQIPPSHKQIIIMYHPKTTSRSDGNGSSIRRHNVFWSPKRSCNVCRWLLLYEENIHEVSFCLIKVRSNQASASASSLMMDHIKFQLSHSHQVAVAVASLVMTLGIALGSIGIFDASDDADADARSERALSHLSYMVTSSIVTRITFIKSCYVKPHLLSSPNLHLREMLLMFEMRRKTSFTDKNFCICLVIIINYIPHLTIVGKLGTCCPSCLLLSFR